jgi:hypothetical protein
MLPSLNKYNQTHHGRVRSFHFWHFYDGHFQNGFYFDVLSFMGYHIPYLFTVMTLGSIDSLSIFLKIQEKW